jgi:hypothetical protein
VRREHSIKRDKASLNYRNAATLQIMDSHCCHIPQCVSCSRFDVVTRRLAVDICFLQGAPGARLSAAYQNATVGFEAAEWVYPQELDPAASTHDAYPPQVYFLHPIPHKISQLLSNTAAHTYIISNPPRDLVYLFDNLFVYIRS